MLNVLASVTDKSGLDDLISKLQKFSDVRLIATTSTASFLQEKGFQCTKVEELTKFPEMLAGRVKTLHPHIFGGILARPLAEDRRALTERDIPEIDIVIVNLYAFEKKLQAGLSEPEMIENIDIGGVALLRAAAKNFERVTVLSDPKQYQGVIDSMEANGGKITATLRKRLAWESFQRTASYDQSISNYLGKQLGLKMAQGQASEAEPAPEELTIRLHKHQDLRYGENPHFAAAWYSETVSSNSSMPSKTGNFPPFEQLQGKELSFNNIVDVFALSEILKSIAKPSACIIKHNNPCGVALGANLAEAYSKAYQTDPTSAFGGVYGLTDVVDGKLAAQINEGFVEIVLAPGFDREALDIFAKKKNLRVLRVEPDFLKDTAYIAWRFKDLKDFGWLAERTMEPEVSADKFQCVTKQKSASSQAADIAFAWSVVKHLTSNAIFVAKNGCSLGFGIGQTSRIASVDIALKQAGQEAKGAVLASDAFFPAIDNINSAAKAGISVIIQPGGSLKDKEVIAACDEAGIAMLLTGQRCFKH